MKKTHAIVRKGKRIRDREKERRTTSPSGCSSQFHFHFNPLEISEGGNKGQKLEVKERFVFSPPVLPSQNWLLQPPPAPSAPPILSIWPQYCEIKDLYK